MNRPLKILGIAGSIRHGSYNSALLRAAAKIAPENLEIEVFDITNIPFFNEDLENDPPDVITEFKKKISEADGLLFSTPEYNYSIPGVLKNAIDWASRPSTASPLDMKPTAIMGGTIGMSGTIRSQQHLRQVALSTNMMDMKKPEVLVARIHEKFDKDLVLTDEPLKEYLKKFLLAFENWISIFKHVPPEAEHSVVKASEGTPSRMIPSQMVASEAGLSEIAKFWAEVDIE